MWKPSTKENKRGWPSPLLMKTLVWTTLAFQGKSRRSRLNNRRRRKRRNSPKGMKKKRTCLQRSIEPKRHESTTFPPACQPTVNLVAQRLKDLSDVSSIGACRPRIFFINGFLCFLEDEWQQNGEGRERGDATSRRR